MIFANQIGIIADDLTGANDTALQFQKRGAITQILLDYNNIGQTSTDMCVWATSTESRNIPPEEAVEKVKNAVMATKGMVLMYNNNYIDAVYHSTSNGMTEDALYIWGYDIPYLKSVESKTDINVSSYKKEVTFTLEKLSTILNTTITKDTTFILERNSSGRVSNVKVNDLEIKGTTFRTLLNLRSTDFVIELNEETAKITTYGYGHGVGMSQYGANGMANKGYTFRDILNHYYQNTSIKNI